MAHLLEGYSNQKGTHNFAILGIPYFETYPHAGFLVNRKDATSGSLSGAGRDRMVVSVQVGNPAEKARTKNNTWVCLVFGPKIVVFLGVLFQNVTLKNDTSTSTALSLT